MSTEFKVRTEIALTYEQADAVTRQNLMDAWVMSFGFDPDDEVLPYLDRVVEYFSTPSQWAEWCERRDAERSSGENAEMTAAQRASLLSGN